MHYAVGAVHKIVVQMLIAQRLLPQHLQVFFDTSNFFASLLHTHVSRHMPGSAFRVALPVVLHGRFTRNALVALRTLHVDAATLAHVVSQLAQFAAERGTPPTAHHTYNAKLLLVRQVGAKPYKLAFRESSAI
ncbi:hypothetical protein MRX96_000986 [Rhipicephalus microplus]